MPILVSSPIRWMLIKPGIKGMMTDAVIPTPNQNP
jgi:hypothetical protein